MKLRVAPGMKTFSLFLFLLLGGYSIYAQTCTITDPDGNPATNTTVFWLAATCSETGLAPVNGNSLIVPDGVVLFITNSGGIPVNPTPFFTGNVTVFGQFVNNKTNSELDGSIEVKNGGKLTLNTKLFLGDAAGCGYTIIVRQGGLLDLTGAGAADRLTICGAAVAQSGGGCNPFPTGPLPYCEPASGGFPSPLGFDETGLNPTLPVRLVYFTAEATNDNVSLKWATSKEENFDRFELERASGDLNFIKIAEVPGAGYNTETLQKYTWLDSSPYAGENYYRLKAVDLDGTFDYFKITSASASGNKKFSVFPNPAKESSVNYSLNFDYSENDRILVMDNMGNLVQQASVSSMDGKLAFADAVKPGLYFVRYVSDNFTQTVRLMVR